MDMMIYEMPYGKRLDLERILDVNHQWKDLAKQIRSLTSDDVGGLALAAMRPGGSPTGDLLTMWGQSNPSVGDLFYHIKAMKNKRALNVLRGVVPDKLFEDLDKETAPCLPLRTSAGPVRMKTRPQSSHPTGNHGNSDTVSELDLPSCSDESANNNQGVVRPLYCNTPTGTPVPPYQSQTPSLDSDNRKQYRAVYCPPSVQPVQSTAAPSGGHPFQNGVNRKPTESHCSGSMTTLPDQNQGHRRSQGQNYNSSLNPSSLSSVSALDIALITMPEFTLHELNTATHDFHESNVIGRGGFGVVYRGKLERLKLEVAIKKLNQGELQEIESLFRCRHDNIIPLLGYCRNVRANCLVYAFMRNGSLEDRLLCKNNTTPLTWIQRMNILCGAARAIHYLHSLDTAILHGDIKSANILLDKHFEAKMADFGLAKPANSGAHTRVTHVSQQGKAYGTVAYLPDEYLEDTSRLRKQVDVYSFGIVIFETCLGVKASDVSKLSNGQYKLLKSLIEKYRDTVDLTMMCTKIRDPLCPSWPPMLWTKIIQQALKSTVRSWKKRPPMQQIVDDLERLVSTAEKVLKDKQAHQASNQQTGTNLHAASTNQHTGSHGYPSSNQNNSFQSQNVLYNSDGSESGLRNKLQELGSGLRHMKVSSMESTLDTITASDIVKTDSKENNNVTPPDANKRFHEQDDDKLITIIPRPHPASPPASPPASCSQHTKDTLDVISTEKLNDLEDFINNDSFVKSNALSGKSMDVKNVMKSGHETGGSSMFESDPDKLQAMGSAALVGIQDIEPMVCETEAWILQDTYDRMSEERQISQEFQSNSPNTCDAEDGAAVNTHNYLCDNTGLDSITVGLSSELHGNITREKSVRNLYIRPAGSRAGPSKCPGPPPPQQTTCTSTQWHSSETGSTEDLVPHQREQVPHPSEQVPHQREQVPHKLDIVGIRKPEINERAPEIHERTPEIHERAPDMMNPQSNMYLATQSDSDGNISIRKASSIGSFSSHASSDQIHRSYHPSYSNDKLYCPKPTHTTPGEVEIPPGQGDLNKDSTSKIIAKKKNKVNPLVDKYSKSALEALGDESTIDVNSSLTDTEELVQRKKKNKGKSLPWIQDYKLYQPTDGPSACVEGDNTEHYEDTLSSSRSYHADPVEHHQSLTGSECSDYQYHLDQLEETNHGVYDSNLDGYNVDNGRSFHPDQAANSKMGISHMIPGQTAMRVVTSGSIPTTSNSSPPIYQQANLH